MFLDLTVRKVELLRTTNCLIRALINTQTALGAGVLVNDGFVIIQRNGYKRTKINTNAAPCADISVYFRCHSFNLPVLTGLFGLGPAAFAEPGLRPVV